MTYLANDRPLTIARLHELKRAEQPIVVLTAYDYSFARVIDDSGVDVVLVGDSLGNVIQGHATTLPVTVDNIVYHCQAVSRGLRRALLIADMPFMSAPDPATAARNGGRMLAEGGAQMVKLEGAGPMLDCVRHLTQRDIPVCAHLGLTPQSVHRLSGYRVQGREASAAERLRTDALAVVEAGAELLVLELVPSALATEIAKTISIPVIGIGAGAGVDGQVLVLHDLLGLGAPPRPRFVKDFLAGQGSIAAAIQSYAAEVRARSFPGPEHGY